MVNTAWIKSLKTPIAIVGLGKSGNAALQLLRLAGFNEADLITYDIKDSAAQLVNIEDVLALKPPTVVVSPGVPLNSDWIVTLQQSGSLITSEISLAASLLTTEKTIGVTGSVGKSTVVSILEAGARNEDSACFVGGNLGTAFCTYATGLLQGKPRAKWVVLELSSYQLENCAGLKLDFSAITYLSENHLERYKNVEHYYKTKLKITEITDGVCVFNQTCLDCIIYSAQSVSTFYLTNAASDLSQADRQKIKLIGAHNHDNFSVAHKLARLAGWSEQSIDCMYSYEGLPHRLETVGMFNGILFVNDSKATAMDPVLVATAGCLEKISSPAKLFLLLGGKDKNLPWNQLKILKSDLRIHFVFFGACGPLAKESSMLTGEVFKTLNLAIDYCLKNALKGDTVLLSPGGTSLDEFKNFEERGNFFKQKITQ